MKNKITLLTALFAVLAFAVLMFWPNKAESTKSDVTKKVSSAPQLPQSYIPIFTDRTEAGVKRFWAEYLNTTFNDIFNDTFNIHEIQQRITFLRREVERYHGVQLKTSAVTTYSSVSKMVGAGAGFIDGAPTLEIMVQRMMDLADELRAKNKESFPGLLKVHLAELILHELEHLYREKGKRPQSKEEYFAAESAAWAETCRFVIVPLIEKYNIVSSPDSLKWYGVWVASDRDEQSQRWKDFIRDVYTQSTEVMFPR